MTRKSVGPLMIIGGKEEKCDSQQCVILKEIAAAAIKSKGGLVIVTAATNLPLEVGAEYTKVFKRLGLTRIQVLDIRTREQAASPQLVKKLSEASVIFFTGGDQLRITSQLGATPFFEKMLEIHRAGGMIAGTSAGAAAMPETMVFQSESNGSERISALGMAPGLGLLPRMVIDSHFAERGRFARLLGAVAQNPKNLGIGIDENTAILVEHERSFRVLGSGAVYVFDGTHIEYCSLSEEQPEDILSIFDVRLHVLSQNDRFDLDEKKPVVPARSKQVAGER